MVRLLLTFGAGSDQYDLDDALSGALDNENQNQEVISVLLEHGADVNHPDGDAPPLSLALNHARDMNIAKILLDRGADVHEEDVDGQTPLFYAIHNSTIGNLEPVELILSHGAKANHKDNDGKTPLSVALRQMLANINNEGNIGGETATLCWDIVKLLVKHSGDGIGDALESVLSPSSNNRRTSSILEWIDAFHERTILNFKTPQEFAFDDQLQRDFDVMAALLWLNFYGLFHLEHPPFLQNTRNLSDEDFKSKYQYMIHSLSSLLYVKNSCKLLRQLSRVYSSDWALMRHMLTGKAPWMIAVDLFPEWKDNKQAVKGLEFLLLEWNPQALRQRDTSGDGNRSDIPLVRAIRNGVPLKTILKLAKGWRHSVLVPDPATGLPSYLVMAAVKKYYSLSDLYTLSRMILPKHLAKAEQGWTQE